jgi:hypothetical protein
MKDDRGRFSGVLLQGGAVASITFAVDATIDRAAAV